MRFFSDRDRTKCVKEIIKTFDGIDDLFKDQIKPTEKEVRLMEARLTEQIMERYNIEEKIALELIKASKNSMPYWNTLCGRKHSIFTFKEDVLAYPDPDDKIFTHGERPD